MPCIYHVSPKGDDYASGRADAPFRTIDRAAREALPGDTVLVHEGEYREWVNPRRGGLSDVCRITYEAAPGEKVVIKGSEIVTGWIRDEGGVWKKELPNSMFGDWDPFARAVEGDWLIFPDDHQVHTGDVYLNGVSMYEAITLEECRRGERRTHGHQVPGKDYIEAILRPDETIYQWYADVQRDVTVLYVNFHDVDPNAELVEINVRPYCFYPEAVGVNYITVRGFEMCQAACPFTPPTADQPGMLGAHWSKGWVIENNHLHDAKCSAISLGKEATTGHNLYSRFGRKPGYQYQMEAVFLGLQAGWCKEKIGSHVVRNNVIHDCGQNGVVGHMGCAFSRIEHNHIYNIGVKHEFFGWEIGGIKLHAAVDTLIEGNNIHHCTLGTWLDWQAQGTRVTKNVYHHNDRDFMIEVTHGPCLIDNNIFASAYNCDNMAQGTAWVHNLCCGFMRRAKVLDRATPYHFPHTTQVAGCAVVYGGDDRLVNNLFTGTFGPITHKVFVGTDGYDDCTTAQEYPALLHAEGNTDEAKYYKVPQPAYVQGNAYAGCAGAFRGETDAVRCDADLHCSVEQQGDAWVLCITLPETLSGVAVPACTTAALGMPRITEEPYENADGTPVDFTAALVGVRCGDAVLPGPVASAVPGENRIVVWQA